MSIDYSTKEEKKRHHRGARRACASTARTARRSSASSATASASTTPGSSRSTGSSSRSSRRRGCSRSSAAPTRSASASTSRSAPCSSRSSASSTARRRRSSACATSSRSAGAPGARASTIAGSVVAQAPEHVIENLRLEAKAGSDPAKKRKIVRKKPPEKGYVHWDKATFDRLVTVAARAARLALPRVARDAAQRARARRGRRLHGDGAAHHAIARARSRRSASSGARRSRCSSRSLDAGIIERASDGTDGASVVNVDLQEDFSLNHALSLYLARDARRMLDRESRDVRARRPHAGRVDPREPRARSSSSSSTSSRREKIAELKAAGVEYDERMAELEKLEYPKPNRDFIYETFNAFAAKHPWVAAGEHPPEVDRARDVRDVHVVRRVRARVRARARRGAAPPLPVATSTRRSCRRVPGWAKNEARRRDRHVLRRDRARRSTRACSTSGSG